MSYDLIIPFLILILIVIYLIYTRTKFENQMISLYESKFEEWKKHTQTTNEKKICKELVGLIYKEEHKLSCEIFNKDIEDRLNRAKFDIKYIGNKDE